MDRQLRNRLRWGGLGACGLACILFRNRPVFQYAALLGLALYMAGLSLYQLLRDRRTPRKMLLIETLADWGLLAVLAWVTVRVLAGGG